MKSLFVWLDAHPGSYWVLAAPATMLLVGWIMYTAVRELRATADAGALSESGRARWMDGVMLLLFVLAWRWPFLLSANEFNPDESQLISGAITLADDPVFWRSVDGTTSGPLNFYVLLPIHLLGLPLDYFTVRLFGLLLVVVALVASLRALIRGYGRTVAWLGVLPAVGFFATAMANDYIQYSSETLALLLVAVAVWLLATRERGDRIRLWTACAIAGSAPWAKLQVSPLSVALVGWALWQQGRYAGGHGRLAWEKMRGALLAALAPSLAVGVAVAAAGQLDAAVRRYFLLNIHYAELARPLTRALGDMWVLAQADGRLAIFMSVTGATMAAAGVYLAVRRIRPSPWLLAAALLGFSAVIAVIAPRREYLHYTLLLPIPLALLSGALIGETWQTTGSRGRALMTVLLLSAGIGPLAVTRYRLGVPAMYGQFLYHWRHPATPTAAVVRALAGRGDSLAVWGWEPRLYVETGMRQATREGHAVWEIVPSSQRDYLRACYLADFRRNRPAVFVDAVGDGSFAMVNRADEGHEVFPELAREVRRNYTPVYDLSEGRIYLRNDLAAGLRRTRAQLDDFAARGRLALAANAIESPLASGAGRPRWVVEQREVTMLQAPAQMEWALGDDVRQVVFRYGFAPAAYLEGATNGADLILELVQAGRAEILWRRRLEPKQRVSDRGIQNAVVTLPPSLRGARLLLRTDPGDYGDNAWDWVYLGALSFKRSAFFFAQQFPGLNPVPNFVDGQTDIHADSSRTGLEPPASVGFLLHGDERFIEFNYDVRVPADSTGQPAAIDFRVELSRADGEVNELHYDRIEPAAHSAAVGPRSARLLLPTFAAGDRLTLSTQSSDGTASGVAVIHLGNVQLR